MFRGWTPRLLAPSPSAHMPRNHRPALIHRLQADMEGERGSADPLARAPALALLEAALLIADEPLPLRKLVQITGIADASTVRRWLTKLQDLYDQDGSAFELEELAGGFQLMTRPNITAG